LMWKDLVQRVGQLEQNRVVRHLIHDPDKPFASESRGSMPHAHEIDCRYRPQDIVHPLPADSSQLAAVMAAAEGHDMVIVGPPGTGKSQTIANLITQCLAVGKTVLFVAEKTAALDVVYRRLRKHGLGDCCIELHSNKAERRRFLDQLEASWTNRSQANAAEWITICEQLQVRRDELNAYAAAVHVEDTNGWTAYRAMGECIRGRDCVAPRLDWDSRTRHTREDFKKFEETIANLATIYQAAPVKDPIQRLEATDWSVAWENGMLQSCQELFEAAEALAAVIRTMSGRFGILPAGDVNAKQLSVLYRFAQDLANSGIPVPELVLHGAVDELARALQTRHELLQRSRAVHEALHAALQAFCAAIGHPQQDTLPDAKKQALLHVASELVRSQLPPAELVFHSQFDSLMERLSERPHLLQARANALSALVARSFNPALIDRVPSDLLERQWKAANETFWPLAVWLKWCLGQTFKAYMTPSGTPAPEIDLQLLREYRECCQRVAQNMASLGVSAQLQEVVDKDPAEFLQLLQAAQRMRTVLMGAGLSPVNVGIAAHGRWEPLVAAVQRLYTPVREIDSLTTQLKENLKSLGLSPKLQQVVEKDTNALSSQIEAANKFRAAVVTLGVSPAELAGFLQRLHTIDSEFRRSISVEYCRAAKKFQEAWVAYSRHAGITPVGSESQSIVADAAAQAKYVQSRRTALKQWTAWTAIRRRAVELGLGGFVDALQSGEMSPAVAQERFRLAYARWWLPTAIDRLEPLRKFQRFLHERLRSFDVLMIWRARPPRLERAWQSATIYPPAIRCRASPNWGCFVIK
jgi:DNA polymerase III delta prime subunit